MLCRCCQVKLRGYQKRPAHLEATGDNIPGDDGSVLHFEMRVDANGERFLAFYQSESFAFDPSLDSVDWDIPRSTEEQLDMVIHNNIRLAGLNIFQAA